MRYIANIVTKSGNFADAELYNIITDKNDIIEELPTLIVGWEYTKSILGDNVNILDWQIDEKTYWTFGNREKRDRYESCIKKFRKIAIENLLNSKKYVFFNVLTATTEEKKAFIQKITSETDKIIYINNDIVYIYEENSDNIVGFSLRDVDYEDGDRKRIFNLIYNNQNIRIVKTKENFTEETKRALEKNQYLIPYLCE